MWDLIISFIYRNTLIVMYLHCINLLFSVGCPAIRDLVPMHHFVATAVHPRHGGQGSPQQILLPRVQDWPQSLAWGTELQCHVTLVRMNLVYRVSLNTAHALHGGVSDFAFVCVCLCVCLWTRYLKKYWTNKLHFWWEPSLWPREETIRFWKISPRVKGGCEGSKIWP